MTQDEIKELIKECRNPVGYIGNWGRVQWADNVYPQLGDDLYAGVDLETFAKLVAAKEREACAKVSEAKGLSWKSRHDINPDNAEKAYMASQFIASAIRARGEA